MKTSNFTFLLLFIFASLSLSAQNGPITEGYIEYEVRINLHKNLPKEREEMKNMMPEFQTFRTELYFNPTESFYQIIEEDEDPDAPGGGRGMRFRMAGMVGKTYTNTSTEEKLTNQEFFNKNYLIVDTLKVLAWKFGDGSKTIMGYPCMMATFLDTARKQTVNAWYTMGVRPFLGPDMYGSLPGAILEMEFVEMNTVVSAKVITPKTLKKNDIKKPTSGERISRAQFNQTVKEQIENMRKNGFNFQTR
jgi:GLPGLI family protein